MRAIFWTILVMLAIGGHAAEAAVTGDINGDGVVDQTEAVYALQVTAGIRAMPAGNVIHAKNIVLMIGDGMGLADVTAARIYKNGHDGAPLHLETLPYIGYQRTHSKNRTITDSAAAASAMASGEKFNNEAISCIDETPVDGVCDGTRKNARTLLEIAHDMGKATGLVVTSDITHATPAAFGAHVHNRNCGTEIFRQYLTLGIDVMMGAYVADNRADKGCLIAAENKQSLIDQAPSLGYTRVSTAAEMIAAASSAVKMLGLFNATDGWMRPLYLRSAAGTEPTLIQMTANALKVLEKNANGFFLLVEGSQIDRANHANNMKFQIEETLDFDNAVKTVMDWMDLDDTRKRNTLIIVTADHETGGFAIKGPTNRLAAPGDTADPYKGLVDDDGKPIVAPDLTEGWTGGNHTAVDTLVWSNSTAFSKAMDNTDIHDLVSGLMQ